MTSALNLRRLFVVIVVGIALVAKPDQTRPATLAAVAVILSTVAIVHLRKAEPWSLVALVALGVAFRLFWFRGLGSDVLPRTVAAIHQALNGGNPYGVGQPGMPFPYGPMSLLWYLPVQFEPRLMELAASLVVLLVLAAARRPIGLAIYACAPILVLLATDGSNDTSAGLMIGLALVVAEDRPRAGGILLAIATAFKPYAAAWLLPLVAWAGLAPLLGFLVTSVVAWSPLLLWGPGTFIGAMQRAEDVHDSSYYSLAAILGQWLGKPLARDIFGPLRLALGLAMAAATWVRARSHDAVVVAGTLVFLVTMYAAYWGTPAYLAALAPILCWKVDRWVARPSRPGAPTAPGPLAV